MDLWFLLHLSIVFSAAVLVLTFSTLRIIFVARGHRVLAPLLGFFEILTWLFAMRAIMKDMDDLGRLFAYAFGFTFGSFLGIIIEKKLAMGTVIVRIITHRDAATLIQELRKANFGVTSVEGHGASGKVQIVMTVVKRRQLPEVAAFIESHHPNAFYAVDDLQSASEGIFPPTGRLGIIPQPIIKLLRMPLKGTAFGQPAIDAAAEIAPQFVVSAQTHASR